MIQNEVVTKKKWMSEKHFLDLLSITHLIPGPNSTEMAIHIGYDQKGWKGLLVAGICFIFPVVIITGVFAYFYALYGKLPEIQAYIYGIQLAIIAVILTAILPLVKKNIKGWFAIMLAIIVCIGAVTGINELLLMLFAGVCVTIYQNKKSNIISNIVPLGLFSLDFSETNQKLFLIFLKIGAILYGSGYVLFAFLETELVKNGCLSQQQLIDVIAVGQFTPGPVFSSVSFIGYQINGFSGLVYATLAIFIPSFALVWSVQPLTNFLKKSVLFSSFLNGLNLASLALIAAVTILMSKYVLIDWKNILIFLCCLIALLKFEKINSAFIVFGGALFGYILSIFF